MNEILSEEPLNAPPRAETEDHAEDLLAVIYARTSSNSQRFGYSIDEQVRRCWEFCRDANWEVVFVFTDEAESGRDRERPEFQLMLERAREGLFDVVVFWKLDRFCRSLVDLVKTEEELDDLSVGLHSVTEFLDTTNPVGRFNFRNLASAAELESDLTSQRVKLGMYGLAKDHKWPNDFPPMGYQKEEDNTLTPDERESKTVRQIFNLYLDERSMPQVAYVLNEQGIPTKQNGEWSRWSVKKILSNELYRGQYQLGEYEEFVEDYRIVSDKLYNSVTETRYRFKHEKDSIGPDRKRSKAENILTEFKTAREESE